MHRGKEREREKEAERMEGEKEGRKAAAFERPSGERRNCGFLRPVEEEEEEE